MNSADTMWKKCSSCRKPIGFGAPYYVCSVSTCQHTRKGFQFCSVPCWDAHLGYANHREAWALEKKAPSHSEMSAGTAQERAPKRQVVDVKNAGDSAPAAYVAPKRAADQIQTDTLVVVSKIKTLIRDQSEFNTSQCCIDALTRKVVEECLKGIERARKAERKTVMGRDIT